MVILFSPYWAAPAIGLEPTAVADLMHVVARAPEILRHFLGELIGSEGITVFHLPDAVLLALVVGILELVPVIGPFASATIVGLVAIQQKGIWAAGFLFGFAIELRLSVDNLAGPIVLGEAARIHPVVVIMSFVCGAILFGVVGLLLAVPIGLRIKVALQEYYAEPIARGEPGRSG